MDATGLTIPSRGGKNSVGGGKTIFDIETTIPSEAAKSSGVGATGAVIAKTIGTRGSESVATNGGVVTAGSIAAGTIKSHPRVAGIVIRAAVNTTGKAGHAIIDTVVGNSGETDEIGTINGIGVNVGIKTVALANNVVGIAGGTIIDVVGIAGFASVGGMDINIGAADKKRIKSFVVSINRIHQPTAPTKNGTITTSAD